VMEAVTARLWGRPHSVLRARVVFDCTAAWTRLGVRVSRGLRAAEAAAGLAGMLCGGRGKLRLMWCVPRTVRSGARLRRSSLDKVCRDNPPLQL